jgi:hypothetical protein
MSLGAVPLFAQVPGALAGRPAGDRLRVFVDCNRCNYEHLRQTVGFVDYVLDRLVADFHVLTTAEETGGGGLAWTVQFIGQERFRDLGSTLRFQTPSTATDSERNTAFERIFMLGLAGHAAGTSAAPELDVKWTAPTGTAAMVTSDPWKAWVINIRLNGSVDGEESSSSRFMNLRVSSNRTTEALKVTLSAFGNVNRRSFAIGDGERVTNDSHSWNVNGLIVRSVGPRWSVGATGSVSHSSFSNTDREIGIAPAIEFDLFPYAESSRRSLTFHYAVGATKFQYTSLTIFDKLEEIVPRQSARVSLALDQPWGTLSTSGTFDQHLRHLNRTKASVDGSADVRLFKGFSFNTFFRYQRIRDQISLRKEEVSEQDVLLRNRQLATGYNYFINFGITYRFGSIFNNVVNSRFDAAPF